MGGFRVAYAVDYACPLCGYEDTSFEIHFPEVEQCRRCGCIFTKNGDIAEIPNETNREGE